jgi:hypothetical protein
MLFPAPKTTVCYQRLQDLTYRFITTDTIHKLLVRVLSADWEVLVSNKITHTIRFFDDEIV